MSICDAANRLLLLVRVLCNLFLDRLAGEASRANRVEFVAEDAHNLRRYSMVQEGNAVLNLSLIVLRDGSFVQMLPSCGEFPLRRQETLLHSWSLLSFFS